MGLRPDRATETVTASLRLPFLRIADAEGASDLAAPPRPRPCGSLCFRGCTRLQRRRSPRPVTAGCGPVVASVGQVGRSPLSVFTWAPQVSAEKEP